MPGSSALGQPMPVLAKWWAPAHLLGQEHLWHIQALQRLTENQILQNRFSWGFLQHLWHLRAVLRDLDIQMPAYIVFRKKRKQSSNSAGAVPDSTENGL